jgi:RNA-directed DNA polymerase
LCQEGNAEAGLDLMRRLTGKLKLMVNEDKPPICTVPEKSFDFLGHTFGRMHSAKLERARLSYRPSKKSIERAVNTVHALTERRSTWQHVTVLVAKFSRALRG